MSRLSRRVRQSGVYFVTTDTWQRRQVFLKPDPARILLEQLLECRAKGYYKLHAFAVMPEHLHILITPGETTSLEKAVMMIKGGSSHRIKQELLYHSPIWMKGFHDRWIRDLAEYRLRKQYIEQNPVKAQLAKRPQEYVWSSAGGQYTLDPSPYDEELQRLKPLLKQARNVAPEGATHKSLGRALIYQLSWKILPGLKGLSCSEFRATLTDAPNNEQGVAFECGSEAECAALMQRLEAHFSAARFSNNASAFESVKTFVLEMRQTQS